MMISTVAIGEYCVGGNLNELPLKNLQILPYNLNHAVKAGEFARAVFLERGTLQVKERNIIPNDTKLFAQADTEVSVEFYLTADEGAIRFTNC